MKTEFVRICAVILGIVAFAAAQDVSPTVLDAKPPLLLAFGCVAGIPAAVAAGLFADVLGGLPFGCSAMFFFAAALLVRLFRSVALVVTLGAAVAYQLWLALWGAVAVSDRFVCGVLLVAALFVPPTYAFVRFFKIHIGLDDGGDAR